MENMKVYNPSPLVVIFLVLLLLKAFGAITVSWWIVFAPLLCYVAGWTLVIIGLLIIYFKEK